jgi:hypothetical protein
VRAAEPAVEPGDLDEVGVSGQHLAAKLRQDDRCRREGPRVSERRRGRDLLDERLQLEQPLPDPGIAREDGVLPGLARDEELRRAARALEQRLEQLALGAREAALGVG